MRRRLNTPEYTAWQVGARAQIQQKISPDMVHTFTAIVGDQNPIHQTLSPENPAVVPGALLSSLATGLVGSQLPGNDCILSAQQSTFLLPTYVGDIVTVQAEITAKDDERQQLTITTRCLGEQQEVLMNGTITVQIRRR
jgi:3-hydroxybutyryl-CoA dehydratase